MKLLMVCMGNVCRSPMAQVVTLRMAEQARLGRDIQIDSAGTHAGNGRETADPRAQSTLAARGYPACTSRARRVIERDFDQYDVILAMDQANLDELRRVCPAEHQHKLHLFLEFAQCIGGGEVPDPYYGNVEGFERVLDLCEAGARGLVTRLQEAPWAAPADACDPG
ncbi:MAG: low molecular weight protein-tyrosine-phosphatase [Rhodoferax sp.]